MEAAEKIRSYKDVCFKIGLVLTAFFLSRTVCSWILAYIQINLSEYLSETTMYISQLWLSGIFLYIIPIVTARMVLGDDNRQKFAELYKRPPRLAKAIGNFPALYGMGQLTNFLFLGIVALIARIRASQLDEGTIEHAFAPMQIPLPPNVMCGVFAFIHITFAAAVFEEYLCRGILLNALKPFGHGFAIIVTGVLFGLIHGNVHQFTFATVLGIVLAYITIQTGSILAATILHGMFNAMGATMLLFLSTETIQDYVFNLGSGGETVTNDSGMMLRAVYGMYLVLFFGLLIAGIAFAVKRLTKLKSYKAENPFTEIGTKQKTVIFLTSVPVIMMLLLAADSFAGGIVSFKIYESIWGI
jgi:hypothetical protein